MVMGECGAVGGMRLGRGNQSTWRKSAPVVLCPPIIALFYLWITRDRPVGTATGCAAGVQFPAGARDLSLLCSVQTDAQARLASYTMGAGGKAAGA
jgi:hypothetical protein